jgi:hypothetical protein
MCGYFSRNPHIIRTCYCMVYMRPSGLNCRISMPYVTSTIHLLNHIRILFIWIHSDYSTFLHNIFYNLVNFNFCLSIYINKFLLILNCPFLNSSQSRSRCLVHFNISSDNLYNLFQDLYTTYTTTYTYRGFLLERLVFLN